MAYQYDFYGKNGRWPNWNDAMAHCGEALKVLWRTALIEKGVDVDGGKVFPEKAKP